MKKLFIFVFLVIFVGLGFKIYGFWRQRIWDGQSQLNLVVQSQPTFVAALAPQEGKLTVLLIPDDTLIETIHGHGFYRLKSIFGLGQLEGQGSGLLQGSLQEFLGIPLDGYLRLDNLALETGIAPEMVKKLILVQIGKLLKTRDLTNLNTWDLVNFWWQLKKIRPGKIAIVDLGQSEVCSQTTLADGSQTVSVDTQRLDQIVNQLFEDEKIRSEALAIAVLNGTSQFGLAKKVARLINNAGGRVVEIGDWQEGVIGCELRGKKSKTKTYTSQKLEKVFNCQWRSEDVAGHRADLVIILGED